jgi:hypothetical protein
MSRRSQEESSWELVWWHNPNFEYGDESRQQASALRRLLQDLERDRGISCRVVEAWNDAEEKKTYNTLFLRYRNRLRKYSGNPVTQVKSRSGNVLLQDVFLVLDRGQPLCFFEMRDAMNLLEGLRREGPGFLEAWMDNNARSAATTGADSEQALVNDFLKSRASLGFPGEIQVEAPLHVPSDSNDAFLRAFSEVSQKVIDIVHRRDDSTWDVIEAKKRLNWTAFGQALGYAAWFAKVRNVPEKSVRPVIICRQTDDAVSYVCEKYGVKVVLVPRPDSGRV